jgi:tRNA(Ile)-lysidine synthase
MRYLVAVSGGIDSVVLLHKLVQLHQHELIVAHFDHGIREDSADDARFVESLASLYGLPFVTKREVLGANASEEKARLRRHAFLKDEASKMDAVIITAHHADDVLETIAINVHRGTGWRGLGIMNQPGIARPLIMNTKQELRNYALEHRLEWVEDSTNVSDVYLRNRLRRVIGQLLDVEAKKELLKLWHTQLQLRQEIEKETQVFIKGDNEYNRYLFINIDSQVASELLQAVIECHTGISPTRPQLERGVIAIKTAKPSSTYELGSGALLHFSVDIFVVRTSGKVL